MTFALALGQVRAHALRYAATMLAIALSVGFVLASTGLVRTLTTSVEESFAARYEGTAVVIEGVGDRTAASSSEGREAAAEQEARALEIIAATPGVRAVTVDRLDYVTVRVAGEASRGTTVSTLAADEDLRWQPLAEGRAPQALGEVVAPAGEGVRLGESLEVRSGSSEGFAPLTVVGLVDLEGQPDMRSSFPLFVTDEQVGAWAPQGAGGDVRVAAAEGVDDDELLTSLRAGLDPVDGSESFSYRTGDAAGAALASSFMGDRSMYVTVLYAFTLVAVAVAALVIASTFAVLFAARVREVALLRSLGAARWQVAASTLAETLLVAAVASALGLVVGRVGMDVIVNQAPRLGVDLPLGEIVVPARAWWVAFGVGVVMAVLAAAAPLLRSLRVSPLEALRPLEVRAEPWWWRLVLLVTAGGLGAVAGRVLLGAVDDQRVVTAAAAGVACVVALLIAARVLVPMITGLVGTVIGWTLGAPGLLGARYTARNPRRTGATAAALVVGVTLLATLVTGLAAISSAIENRLVNKAALDVVVADSSGILPAGVADRVAAVDGVEAAQEVTVMPVRDPDGKQTLVRVIAADRVDELMRRPVVTPGPGEIVLPESSAAAANARDGDRIVFEFFDGETRELTVRRSPDRWALLGPADAPAWPVPTVPGGGPWPEDVEVPQEFIPRSEVWLRMVTPAGAAEVTPGVEAALGEVRSIVEEASPTLAVTEAFRSREQVQASVSRALTGSALLLAVAVVIALVGVINTMVLSVAERSRENALLRGVGMTRTNLTVMMLFEALLVGVVSAAVGVLAGAALGRLGAGALVGWSTVRPVAVPWDQVGAVAVGGVVAAVLAAGVTALWAVRRPRVGA
ncbi:FtsX-like permease family protein [Microbacter sp. ANSKLAB05]|nr:FtsX-like permease family protein [Microbacter sp. ANSKLAB05]